ncbi:MAG: hypothetical protein H7X89_12200 [Rhizobiales bacterium]|nr:hypothetical protein [Hyphomicrobiales bacterium]
MLKSTLLAATLGLALMAPAYAEDALEMKCDDASMTGLDTEIGAMTDKEKQTMAMNDMKMARDSMAANKMEDCVKFMGSAQQGARGGGSGG